MHPFQRYNQNLLPFHDTGSPDKLHRPLPAEERRRVVNRFLRVGERSPGRHLLLLGAGSGVLARELHEALPDSIRLTVAELQPWRIRIMQQHRPELLHWCNTSPQRQLVTDTSPWALLLLLHAFADIQGITPLRNPELRDAPAPGRYGLLQKSFILIRELSLPASNVRLPLPAVSAAAIVHPQEPDLEGFVAQFPQWLHELVLVWDAESVPAHGLRPAPPLREIARPLNADFSAQRNAMLQACRGDWILYLDSDERLGPAGWELLPDLARQVKVHGFWFPRRTFFPDADHVLAGMGLWPDLQMRLFRHAPGLHFERPVHERLKGVEGAVAIAAGLPIMHYNQLLKNEEQIREKYDLFTRAGGLRHARSLNYPHLSLDFFSTLEASRGLRSLLHLRYNPMG